MNAYTLANLQIIENVLIPSLRIKLAAIYNHVQLINIQIGRHVRLVAVLDKKHEQQLVISEVTIVTRLKRARLQWGVQ